MNFESFKEVSKAHVRHHKITLLFLIERRIKIDIAVIVTVDSQNNTFIHT